VIDLALTHWPFLIGAYLLGSIPTGVLLGRALGADPRQAGSKNIGASNVARVLGKKWGAITLIFDVAKGAIPVLIAQGYASADIALMAGVLAVIGHCYPVWLSFSGGKGVATAFGVVACVLPAIALLSAMTWVTVIYFTRTPAIGSLAAAALFVVLPQFNEHPLSIHLFTLSLAVIILIRHTGNLRTLKSRYTKDKKGRPR
jgi:acyl phosphate:glycerol-3-phosphate acyltransferase